MIQYSGTLVMESKGRGVPDTPLSRGGMTASPEHARDDPDGLPRKLKRRGDWNNPYQHLDRSSHCRSVYSAASTALAISAVPLRPPNSIGLIPPA